jgi:protein phosphatase PTC7
MRRSALRTTLLARATQFPARRSFLPSATSSRASAPDDADRDRHAIILTEETTEPKPIRVKSAPFKFETGYALFAKRPPRPFPPPFLSPPSGSYSEPLSTHNRSRDRRAYVNGEMIRGDTNGDDAVYASNVFIAANDGVGAWSTREGGHAG